MTDLAKHIDNGRMVALELPGFSGQAGYAVQRDGHMIAYQASPNHVPPEPGSRVTVDGLARMVLGVRRSERIARMVVIQVEAPDRGPGQARSGQVSP